MFDHLDPLLKTFWFIAIPSSLIFIIQSVLTLIGLDSGDGLEADFDGDLSETDAPFQLFSFRNLIHFLLGFSWAGISFYSLISNHGILITIAVLTGLLFILVFFLVIRQLLKLAENNSFRIENTLHKTGEVYLAIPPARSGKGKILISVNGAFHELEAMTEQEGIPSNATIKVTRIENNHILIVEII
ncbi:MAG: serine protease [Bacteroidota bacterium]